MGEMQRELARLADKSFSIRKQLEHVEKRLDVFEQIHLEMVRYGTVRGQGKLLEEYFNGGYQRTLELYKELIQDQYRVQRRIFEITKGEFL